MKKCLGFLRERIPPLKFSIAGINKFSLLNQKIMQKMKEKTKNKEST
jgi:hypothetical protein